MTRIKEKDPVKKQHMQEIKAYEIAVANRDLRIAELEAQLAAAQQKSPVVVPKTTSADDANAAYGDAYGVDWVYAAAQQGVQPVAWLAEYQDREGNSKWYVSTHKDLATENDMHGAPKPLYTHPTTQWLDDRNVFEREYAKHAIEYAGLDATVDQVVVRIKEGREGKLYKHPHDDGAWVGWQLALAAQAKQGAA